MVVHLGPLVPCSVSTTPNIAPAAAPPARTGASVLNLKAPTLVDCAHGQGDDGSQKGCYIPPHLRNRPPGRPSCRCTRVWIHRRRRAAVSPSATAGRWSADCVISINEVLLATDVLMPRPADGTPSSEGSPAQAMPLPLLVPGDGMRVDQERRLADRRSVIRAATVAAVVVDLIGGRGMSHDLVVGLYTLT